MRSVRNKRTIKVTVSAHIRYDNKESLKAAIKDITENIYYYMYCEGEFNYLTQCKGGKLKEIIKHAKTQKVLHKEGISVRVSK